MTYRNEMNEAAREARWTVFRFLPLFLLIVVILGAVGFVMSSLGFIGKTVVEREVFEKSYQRSEGLKSEIATNEAAAAEIRSKLTNPNLDENTRYNLEAQLSAIRVRIETARRKQ